jgi:hypothetical protein
LTISCPFYTWHGIMDTAFSSPCIRLSSKSSLSYLKARVKCGSEH